MPNIFKHFFYESPRKKIYLTVAILTISTLAIFLIILLVTKTKKPRPENFVSPISNLEYPEVEETSPAAQPKVASDLATTKDPFHILVLGIDRRFAQETAFRSDINILMSFSADRKTLLLTSIPRDLWIDGSRINAFISTGGADSIKEKIQKVTDFYPDRYVQIDFDAFVEAIDAVGGIDTEVERDFIDYTYPNDREGKAEEITVEFKQGKERMSGERALIYARSRKGTGGEGSDFMRARRQHQILKALPEAFLSSRSIFNPFVLEDFSKIVTERIKTDLSIGDVGFLYELLKTRGDIKIEQVVLDHEYLYNPPSANYGGAYVLRPKNESFEEIHKILKVKIQP